MTKGTTTKWGLEEANELADLLHLSEEQVDSLSNIIDRYPMRIPHYYMSLIDPNDPDDPIRRMSVPDYLESEAGGMEDTSGEQENTIITGMQHKYAQTVMILSTNQCAMYCRHCFRKRFVGLSAEEIANQLPLIVAYIQEHPEINNVLISGGDSFVNSADILEEYLKQLCDIPHIDFIRFGTRVPVVLPQRIIGDERLLAVLEKYGKKKTIYVVTQFNHANELTPEAIQSTDLLRQHGCIVRNQTVLLRGVNDKPEVLAALTNQLVKAGIVPYYIFQCRPVTGVKNQFQIPLIESCRIVDDAKQFMSGQARAVRFAMSHVSGKIEILGLAGKNRMLFKYHQTKYLKDNACIFTMDVSDDQGWLDEIPADALWRF